MWFIMTSLTNQFQNDKLMFESQTQREREYWDKWLEDKKDIIDNTPGSGTFHFDSATPEQRAEHKKIKAAQKEEEYKQKLTKNFKADGINVTDANLNDLIKAYELGRSDGWEDGINQAQSNY